MKIWIICVGKLREKHFALAAEEYLGRLGRFAPAEVVEIAAIPEPSGASDADRERIRRMESERLLARVPSRSCLIAMAIDGKKLDSEGFASFLEARKMEGRDIVFLIGGSLGLSEEALRASDLRLSMSDMTFPHQLARVMLLEQLYRASMISAGQTYHK